MAEKYKVYKTDFDFQVQVVRGVHEGCYVARFWRSKPTCPNAEREARNLCRRLNAAAKKGKVKR